MHYGGIMNRLWKSYCKKWSIELLSKVSKSSMKTRLLIFTIFVFGSLHSIAQSSKLVKIGFIKDMIEKKSDKIQVINFWATWCAPCIKEMPLFEKLHETRSDVKVSLVSVDLNLDPNPTKVHKFVERKKLKSTVYILDERDANVWIDIIEKKWEGAIPATLIVNTNTGKRNFIDKELHEGDLERLIDELK